MAEVIKFNEKVGRKKIISQDSGELLSIEEFEEFRKIFTDTIITLADFSDRHNIDRDSLIRYFALMFKTTADISSFYQFESQKEGE